MKRWAIALAVLFASTFAAQGLAFAMLKALPDASVAALGLGSAQESARAAFREARPARSYPTVLQQLAHGQLGMTLDGIPVADELSQAAAASLPRLAAAIALIALGLGAVAFASGPTLDRLAAVSRLVAFLPPFVAPFVALGILIAFAGGLTRLGEASAIACIAIPPAALLTAQAAAITRRNLNQPFAVTIRAMGASSARLRIRLTNALAMELAPTLEKVLAGLLTALLFVEPVLGLNGLGTVTMRGIARSDPDLILALVLMTALVINLARLGGLAAARATGAGA